MAPGTIGTLGAIAVAWPLEHYLGWGRWHFLLLTILFTPPGIWAAGAVAKADGIEDPGKVVVDEVVGTWLTLVGAAHYTTRVWILAFCLFRIFDIWKPFPARRLERLHGGLGIVADDLAAGVYGALVMSLAGWFNLV